MSQSHYIGLDVWARSVNLCAVDHDGLVAESKFQDVENEIRCLIRNFGYHLGKVTAGYFEPRVRELIADTDLHVVADALLLAKRSLREQFGRLDDMLVKLARQDDVTRRFMTVPGVGPLVALRFRVTVDVPPRFARSRTIGAHFGLAPRKQQSGGLDRSGRISRWGSRDDA